jgi:hypothetical protein
LHAEEVGVEQGRKEGLVNEDLLDDEQAFLGMEQRNVPWSTK